MITKPYLKAQLRKALCTALEQAFPELSQTQIEITLSNRPDSADYQCNSAMKLAKSVNLNPLDFAKKWCDHLPTSELIEEIFITGAGFINIRLRDAFIEKHLGSIYKSPRLGVNSKDYQNQKIVLDFSSPNIAKQMHVGHLRSTIIGDAIARLFEFLGAEVLRLNHVGDWGTQFGMLIAYLKRYHSNVLNGKSTANLEDLSQWYKASKVCFDEDIDFKNQAQREVTALQNGAPESLAAWKLICEISRKSYEEIYQLLEVNLIERGESFYNPYLFELVEDLTNKNLLTVSDGAKCIFLPGFITRENTPLPLIIQKSDGGFNYASTDMAAMRYRTQQDGATRIIILTDAGQALHFDMVSKGAETAGYLQKNNGEKVRFDHVPFGLMLDETGKKIKTRSGESEPLMSLIQNAITASEKIIRERGNHSFLEENEIRNLAKTLGINAIKYADLSSNRTSDYKFSYERMLRFEGNTAAFLMYSYVRILSIKQKIGFRDLSDTLFKITHPSERLLALHILHFDEVILQFSEDLLPHRLCEYLYQLAEKFNVFFRDCRVEGSKEEQSRLLLAEIVRKILFTGMQLLGLKMVEKM